jgi:hypothetical protein
VMCSVNMLPNMQLPYLQFYFAMGLAALTQGMTKRAGPIAPPAASNVSSIRPPEPLSTGLRKAG